MEQIIITKPDTTTWALMTRSAVSSVTRAEQKRALLGEDVINMTVESAIPLSFDIGDTINIFGSTYTLNALPKLLKAGKRKFTYDITWEGRQYDLLKPIYLDNGVDGISISPDFPLTGNLEFFLGVLINNANRIFGTGVWVLGVCPDTDYRTLNFSNENCLAVLQRLCKQENFGKEFEIIENAGVCTINIKDAIGQNHATTYEYGKGKGLWDLTRETVSDKNIITRLYVFGANKNLASDYRGYSQRLKLPGNDLSYIEDAGAIAVYGLIEGVKIFDEIFPHRTGMVSSLGATVDEFYDTSMDFDLNAVDGQGNTLYLIAGTTAKIHFNTGNLAGYEFGILSYDSGTKKFKIQTFKDERGLEFPNADSSAFQITAGDNYVIIDIRMPQTYIDAAESALATAGNDYYALVSQPRVQYSQTFDELYFKQKYAGQSTVNVFGIGDNVHITDTDIVVDKTIRLRSFKRDVIRPYKYALDLYDYSEESIAQRLLNSSNETTKIISSNNLDGISGSRHDDKYYTGAEINTALALKAPKASPVFTGEVTISGGSDLILKATAADAGDIIFQESDGNQKGRIWTNGGIPVVTGEFLYLSSGDNAPDITINPAGNVSINGGLHIGGDSDAGVDNLLVDGTIKGESLESITAFSSGFFGQGYKVIETGGISSLEVDNLRVRGTLSAYEIEINKISSVNGGLVISPANGTTYKKIGTNYYFDTNNLANPIQFKVGDFVRAQNWTGVSGEVITAYSGVITAVVQGDGSLGTAYITATTVLGTPWDKMDLVLWGSSDTGRQSMIYLTAHDANNPYIAGYAGVGADGDTTGHKIFQLGNLAGITDATLSPSGYGLYSQNVFLSGKIVISSGSSGYGNISDKPTTLNAIESGAGTKLAGIATGATVGATWGTNLSGIPSPLTSPGSAGLYLTATYMGYYNGSTWPSYIDNAGNCKFMGVAEIGTNWTDGTLGQMSVSIKGNNIYEGHFNDHGGHLDINMVGQDGGTTYSRDLRVGDGRGYTLFTANGFLRTVDFNVPITCNSTLGVTGVASFSSNVVLNNTNYNSLNTTGGIYMRGSTQGLILTSMSTTARDAQALIINGLMIYNSTVGQFQIYVQSAWKNIVVG